jgi:hypothetical protein
MRGAVAESNRLVGTDVLHFGSVADDVGRSNDVHDRLGNGVRWVVPGQAPIEGRAAVVAACESAASMFADLAGTDVLCFVSVADDHVAAVHATVRYENRDGSVSVVPSADIFEFDADGSLTMITSYAVKLDG